MFCDCHTTNVPPLPHLYTGGLRVSYMDIYKLTSSTHDWNTWQYYHPNQLTHLYTSGLQVGIPTTSLCTPLNPSMFSCIAFMPKKCGLENKKKYFFMRHNPSIPAMSPNVPFFPSTYLKWPRSCSKRSQTGLKGGSDRSHC